MSSYTTTLRHNQIGKGGFAVSFYVRYETQLPRKPKCQQSWGSQVAVKAGLARDAWVYDTIVFMLNKSSLRQLGSNIQQHPCG